MATGAGVVNTVPITYARSQIAPPGEYGCFHVVSRCVRRAFLSGSDQLTGKNFDHRRHWIEERIHFLAESFAVSTYSYAVMLNHTHIVLSVDSFVREAGAAIVPLDLPQLHAAQLAYCRYGKGRHPAALSFGDCMSYALAKFCNETLLFKGDDFSRTDIRPAG